mmetsp:Transcript_125828/g.355800  ORF Transcript_125828/g.355800 Transcript_125828/m.355800 type:complete len:277 (+) Transcript_125828:955-1785(+)
MRRVQHELLFAIGVLVDGRHPGDRAAVGGRERGLPARPVHGVPDLELVLVVHGEDLLVVALAPEGVPDAARRPRLLLHDGVGGHYLEAPELRAPHAVLDKPAVLAHREESQLLGLGPGEAESHDRPPVRLVLRRVRPFLRVGLVVVPVGVPVQAEAPVGVGERQVGGVVAERRVGDAVARVAEGDDLGQVHGLEELAVAVGEADGQELPVRRELKDVRHELLEDLHEVQRARVVVPHVEEARVAAHGDQGQLGVAAQPVHWGVQALQHEPAAAVVG